MRQAVNKRKETLARKKQTQVDKSVTGASVTPTPQPESAPHSATHGGPVTPILLQPGFAETSTPTALPPPPHHQHQQQQQNQPHHGGYGGSMHLIGGGHDGHHPAGGLVLPPPSAMMPHMMDGPPAYPPQPLPRREPARQNPFLDHGYADRGPRLPFLPHQGPEDMGDGRYEHWGPRPQ